MSGRTTTVRPAWLGASAVALLLLGPIALAFFAGGYAPEPQAWAGLAAWALVAVGAVAAPLPRARLPWLAVAALAGLSAWTAASMLWAPVRGSAYHAAQLDVLYVGALLAGLLLLRDRRVQRALEPAVVAGALVVVGYGLSERFLPGLLHFSRSVTAAGRLEQPLTYWNAMGELAAVGAVLCARLLGDTGRRPRLRALAAAAAAPLGLGLYLSFSRGALYAGVAGLLTLLVLAPRRAQARGIALVVVAGGLAAAAAAPFGGLTGLSGALAARERQGAISLVLVAVVAVAAGLAGGHWVAHRRDAPLRLPRHRGWIAGALVVVGFALAITLGAQETTHQAILGGGASRLTTLRSDRYAYWGVAVKAFEAQPVRGVGAGGWAVWWLRDRPIPGFAQDAHSLPLQTLAELGLVGVALLALWVGALARAARAAHRRDAAATAGLIAGLVVYAVHAPLDWDWQLPALTLPALLLAGGVLAVAAGREPVTSAASASPAPVTEPQTAIGA